MVADALILTSRSNFNLYIYYIIKTVSAYFQEAHTKRIAYFYLGILEALFEKSPKF